MPAQQSQLLGVEDSLTSLSCALPFHLKLSFQLYTDSTISAFCSHGSESQRNPGSSEETRRMGHFSQCQTIDAFSFKIKMPLTAFAVRSDYPHAD